MAKSRKTTSTATATATKAAKAPKASKAAKAPKAVKAEAVAKAREPSVIDYKPGKEYRAPRVGSKADALITLMARKNGATLAELAACLADFNAKGIGKQSPETEAYARSWLPQSYLRECFGVGVTSAVVNTKGADGKMRKTLRVKVVKPEKLAAPKVRAKKATKPVAKPRRSKVASMTSRRQAAKGDGAGEAASA